MMVAAEGKQADVLRLLLAAVSWDYMHSATGVSSSHRG